MLKAGVATRGRASVDLAELVEHAARTAGPP